MSGSSLCHQHFRQLSTLRDRHFTASGGRRSGGLSTVIRWYEQIDAVALQKRLGRNLAILHDCQGTLSEGPHTSIIQHGISRSANSSRPRTACQALSSDIARSPRPILANPNLGSIDVLLELSRQSMQLRDGQSNFPKIPWITWIHEVNIITQFVKGLVWYLKNEHHW